MVSFDAMIHDLRCSLHPQLRHYSPYSLRDEIHFRRQFDYWNLPESLRQACDDVFQQTGTTGYYGWENKCVFSIDSLSPPCPNVVLLRNIYVLKKYRGQQFCTKTLAQLVQVAESTDICILAIVHPFEIRFDNDTLEGAVDALHRSETGVWYVGDELAQEAMNARLKKAGFRNCDLRDRLSLAAAKRIPLRNQWIFVPKGVDRNFLTSIEFRLVNEEVNESVAERIPT
jgi:hypothetical protein